MKIYQIIINITVIGLFFFNVQYMNTINRQPEEPLKEGKYGYDLEFLRKYLKPIELEYENARVLISPEYQGRVMTSSSAGMNGFSYGWINHDLIASGKVMPHINAYGGEERLWFGPEGGQFSIFFAPGVPFDVAHWQTPSCIDTEVFHVESVDGRTVFFTKKVMLTNYSGFTFDAEVNRKISILGRSEITGLLNMELPQGIQMVAYETDNRIKNTGIRAWTKETGALSIWLLGMMNPSPDVTIVIPYKKGELGAVVKDDYFGKVPAERLKVTDDAIFFKGDGKYRSKIGVSPRRALPVIGSYDATNKMLTIVECTLDPSATEYVNSSWEIQKKPYAGDVINAYNDGRMADGSQLGPFYELESSSKAAFLKPGEAISHVQRTFHFEGDEQALSEIAFKKLGITIEQMKKIFR